MSTPSTPAGDAADEGAPGSAGGAPLPAHEQQAWEEIVAGFGPVSDLASITLTPPSASASPAAPATPSADFVADDAFVDEGYEPPEPPPIPRPSDAWGRAAWGAVAAGPALVVIASVLSWDRIMVVLGVAVTVGGLAGLVARMKDRRDDDEGDGAVV